MKRWTNLALLVAMALAFLTGWLAFFYAGAPSRGSLILHAISGYAIIALTPWKSVIAAHGLRRRGAGWWASLVLTALVVVSVLAGLLHSSGLLIAYGPFSGMEVHVGAALIAIPFAGWHVMARRIPVRAVDFSRRSFLRATAVLAGAGASYGATEAAIRVLNLPGARRQLTGSYEIGSLQPAALPITQWMFDQIPVVDEQQWQLQIRTSKGSRSWRYAELLSFDDAIEATLDCTGGFYSRQRWSGIWLSRLIESPLSGLSVHVRSVTGYDRRFPIAEAGRLLLAMRLGGEPLDPGHGFPVRLVAPDRRGYWWVKWVVSVTVDEVPPWFALPFPLQ